MNVKMGLVGSEGTPASTDKIRSGNKSNVVSDSQESIALPARITSQTESRVIVVDSRQCL